MSIAERVDVVVVGGGSAGGAAALAFATQGRRVLVLDKRERGATGARWVNGVPEWCFDDAGVGRPAAAGLFGGDRAQHGDGSVHTPGAPPRSPGHAFHLVAPGGRAQLAMVDARLLHVDMRWLCGDLLARAERAGASVRQGSVEEVVVEGGRVRGVSYVDRGGRHAVHASLVVDASGIGAAVRRRLGAFSVDEDIEPLDRCSAAEFQYSVRDPDALARFLARFGAKPGDDIAFSGLAGGFSTLTLFTLADLSEIGVLTGTIPAAGAISAGALLDRFVKRASFLGDPIYGGQGAIPVRRPVARLGVPGAAWVGDAASQVYASHGSGVGMGLLAARALAGAAERSDDPGAPSVIAAYERRYLGRFGGLLTSSDAFRRLAQSFAPADIESVIRSQLLAPSLAKQALEQRPARPDGAFVLAAPSRAMAAGAAAGKFLPFAARSVVTEALGVATALPGIGAALHRAIEPLVGTRAAIDPKVTEWFPDPSAP